MKRTLLILLPILAATLSAQTSSIRDPEIAEVLKEQIDAQGHWDVPLLVTTRFSYAVEQAGGFSFLCEVVSLDPPFSAPDVGISDGFRTGNLKLISALNPTFEEYPELKPLKTLSVGGCQHLRPGDRVIVFVNHEIIEDGLVVIGLRGTNCIVGHRLSRPDEPGHDPAADEELIKHLRGFRKDWKDLTGEDLRIFSRIDPDVRETRKILLSAP